MSIRDRVRSDTSDKGWAIHTNGNLLYRGRVAVPQSADLREEILKDFHFSHFSMQPGSTKMYYDLRR